MIAILRRKASAVARLLTRPNAILLDVPDAWNIRQGRHLTIYPDDVFLVSYPRSGSTWLRFLLANLLDPAHPVTFTSIESRIPDVYQHPDPVLSRMPRPRLLKSHEYLTPRYPGVVYMVRDPRDVAVSNYHYLRKTGFVQDSCSLDEFVPSFIRGEYNTFGAWGDHTGGWIGARLHNPRFLLLRYEDLHTDPHAALYALATFLALDVSDASMSHALEQSSFRKMQSLEKAQSEEWSSTRGTRSDIPFIRSARIGAWREVLSDDSIRSIETHWSAQMLITGYPVSDEL
jgi:hypothetical protein